MQLKKFEVKNFKGFKDQFIFDFSKTKDYPFHPEYIQNHIIQKALIYGKNGVGKSNLGYALFDITLLLGNPNHIHYADETYLNLDSNEVSADFRYEFFSQNHSIIYHYKKENYNIILLEEIIIDNQVLFHYERSSIQETVTLTENEFLKETICLKANQTLLSYMDGKIIDHPLLLELIQFILHMRWYRFSFQKMDEQKDASAIDEEIIQRNALPSLQKFLEDNGIYYSLIEKKVDSHSKIFVHYKKGDIPFLEVASSGTKSLYYYFYFSLFFLNTSLLFIDEFDALYHYETAEMVLKLLFKNNDMQVFVISHNTYLMKNSVIRPDCCFLLSPNKITSLAYSTDKEIQETHNLEKMYRNGAFKE